jgi:hypothetical protein
MVAKGLVRLREVVHTLSPFEQDIMGSLFKDIPYKMNKYWNLWGFDVVVFGIAPYYATTMACEYITHQEELSHRY